MHTRPEWQMVRRAVPVWLLCALLAASALAQPAGTASSGETQTAVSDGRVLHVGGRTADGRPAPAVLEDPRTGQLTPVEIPGLLPRAGHTATRLPDGRVLLLGGVGPGGALVRVTQVLDPTTWRATIVAGGDRLSARSGHSATLLTDGRLLIVGGTTAGDAFAGSVLWDIESGAETAVEAPAARAGHAAVLQPDGSVLVTGGEGPNGATPPDEAFRIDLTEFVPAPPRLEPPRPAYLAGSLPEAGETEVALRLRMALRFSEPIDPATVTDATVRLDGVGGPVPSQLVVAEGGRLAFVTPEAALDPGAAYVVTIDGVRDAGGEPLSAAAVAFTTSGGDTPQPEADGEVWQPTAEHARGNWRTGRPNSPWRQLPPLMAAPGVTALAGQVLALNGRPLPDIRVSLGRVQTVTDRTGRYLLAGVAEGQGVLLIDGTAGGRTRDFGVYQARVFIKSRETNVLGYAHWLPRIDHAHDVRIASPTTADTVITTPFIPGLELHLPKGAVIRDLSGTVVREIGLTPIPVDRPPFPLPTGVQVPVYFTIQPGGAFIDMPGAPWPTGARVVYPNYTGERPGTRTNFWNYDPDERGWYVYGEGSVDARGQQVVPDPGVQIYRFTGTMINWGPTPPGTGPAPWWWPFGDPVDPATGLFVLEHTDLFLPDVLPLSLTRTYRQNDTATRPFGIGATHPYAMFLWSAQQYQEADLVLPTGGRVHYVRTSSGTGFTDAVFEHTSSPTAFYKSQIAWNGNGWDLTLKDGTVYVFGNEAPLQAIRDRFGNTVQLTWSSTNTYGSGIGNLVKVTSPNGRFLAFTYDTSNRITEVEDNIGRTVGYEYDASGRLWKVTDAGGGVTEYTYDTSHRLLTIEDARGIVYLTNQYDANGRVILQTQADSTTFAFDYTLDGTGRVVQTDITNPRGVVDRVTFNASGYPTSHVEALGTALERTTTITRRTDNLVESTTDPLNRETEYSYDTNGNVTAVTRLAGTTDAVTTSFTYESTFHQLASVTDPLNHTTTFGYDSLGRLTTITDPLTHQTTLTYTDAGQPRTVTTALNETTQLGYDLGDLVSVTDPLGRTTTRFVDAAGRLRAVVDAAGQRGLIEYDALNRVTKTTDPRGGETAFTYDANGNLLTLTDAAAHTTTWTYDSMDRVATRTDPLTRQESFTYDANGNLSTWTDRKSQVTTYTYDALGRLTFTGFKAVGTPPTYESTIDRTYDAGDRLTEIVDSVGGTITRTHDLLDRLESETTPEGLIEYTYDAAGRRATMTVDGQPTVAYSYDTADRLTGITQSTASVSYTYDDANRRASVTLPNGIVTAYGYDAASQLTGITYTLGTTTLGDLSYTYDLAGRRTEVGGSWARTNLPAALASASYDAANQIVAFGGVSFTYDDNGNLTSDGTRTLSWNARNQLTGLSGGVNATFAYDGAGRRRTKTVGGTTTKFLYDFANTVQELSTGGTPTANLFTGLDVDEVFTRTDTNGTSTLLTDALGSTFELAGASGPLQTHYTYEPFGGATTSGAVSANPTAFTGREDDGTGLYFYRARFYSAVSQRFISEDPVNFEGGDPNLYAYVFNDPVSLVDPLGEAPFYFPACDPGNPAARKFAIPAVPLLRLLFGDPCDPANMMPLPAPLAAAVGPLGGGFRRLADPLRRLAKPGRFARPLQGLGDYLFARGGKGLLNGRVTGDFFRVGHGWEGPAKGGSDVFRIALGSKRLPFHWHWTLWKR